MQNCARHLLVVAAFFIVGRGAAQNQASQWYFGMNAGLNFMANPPQTLTNSALGTVNYGCASVADASGNLLFYTNGPQIYTSTHTLMANGTGLNSYVNMTQPVLIIPKPGTTTQYFVFTLQYFNSITPGGLYYSLVDMSLSAGHGSVVSKNVQVHSGYVGGKLTGTKHCNGIDYWVVIKDWQNNSSGSGNFRAYQVTSTGVSTTAVVSPGQNNNCNWNNHWGAMKISPNGKKLCLAHYNNCFNSNNHFELWDFDNSTGAVTNSLALGTGTNNNNWGSWGVEFSPDGTKLYGSMLNNWNNGHAGVLQWNLCAGSPTAVAASEVTIATQNINNWNGHGAMQLAPNGKIYIANWWSSTTNTSTAISVINNPNSLGSACNYSHLAQSIAPRQSTWALPNFIGSIFVQPPPVPPYTYTVSNGFGCQAVAFLSPSVPGQTITGCAAVGYSLTNLLWDFGDPTSGSANTSTLTNPIHAYTSLGTYTVKLKFFYSCGGGMDSTIQVVNVNQPCISVSSTSITCASLGSATVSSTGGIGPFSFTWMPSGQTNSVATGLSPGTYTLTVFDFGNNFTYTATTVFTSLIPLTGSINHASSVTCHGASTGTGNVTGLAGGSGAQSYTWTNGVTTLTNNFVSTLSAGVWTMMVVDDTTGCTVSDIFQLTQPPALTMTLTSTTPTSCAGTTIGLSGTVGGGTPRTSGYTYSWTAGPPTFDRVVSQPVAGTYSYVLNSYDSLNCLIKDTITVDFIQNPVLTLPPVSICPLETGTLQVSGASTYLWSNNTTGNTFTASPPSTTSYSVIGSALGCTTAISGLIIVKPVPPAGLGSNSPRCNGQTLQLQAVGGQSYVWNGPLGFFSTTQHPAIGGVTPLHSGVYSFTVTAANSCTASASGTVIVNPTPTLSAQGSTVCVTQPLLLMANSEPGATFQWNGPGSFTSTQQNPAISAPQVTMTGNYLVTVLSADGCSNTAVAHGSVTDVPVPDFVMNSPVCEGEQLYFNSAATSGGVNFSWNGPAGFSSAIANPTIGAVSTSGTGDYTLTVTTGPCVAGISKFVQVDPLPVPVISAPAQICEDKDFDVSVMAPGHQLTAWHWSMPHAMASQPVVNISAANMGHSGSYKVTVTDTHGCKGTSSAQVTILENPTVTATGDTVCINQPAFLAAEGASDYFWYGRNLSDNTGKEARVSMADYASENYLVIGTAVNGCTSTATAMVVTRELPVAGLSVQPDDTICQNTKLIFNGIGGEKYSLFTPGGHNYSGSRVELFMDAVHPSGEYTLVVTDRDGCSGSARKQIHVYELPKGRVTASAWQGCAPMCADFSFSPLFSPNNITSGWTVNKSAASGSTAAGCFHTPGAYQIVTHLTDTFTGCRNELKHTVTVYEKPSAAFTWEPETPTEGFDEVRFINTTPQKDQSDWYWHIEGVSGFQQTEHHARVFEHAGNYRVAYVVHTKYGCADTVVKLLQVHADFNVFVPDAFTPDGDGLNDVFTPVVRDAVKYDLQIFDRWGTRVFSTTTPGHGWDGTEAGEPCKPDSYVWILRIKGADTELMEYNGHVVLVR